MIKDFIVEAIHLINRPTLNDSFIDLKNKTVLFSDFQERFNIYERNLKCFKTQICQKDMVIAELERRIESLTVETMIQKQDLHRLNLYITNYNDENTILIKDRETLARKPLEKRIDDLQGTVKSLNTRIEYLLDLNQDLEQKKFQAEGKLADSLSMLAQLPLKYVPIEQHNSLIEQKTKLEQLHVQLENSYATKCSECDSLQSQISALILAHQKAVQAKEEHYTIELKRLNEQLYTHVKTIERYEADFKNMHTISTKNQSKQRLEDIFNDQLMLSYRFLNLEESNAPRAPINSVDPQSSEQLLEEIEDLRHKLEIQRVESNNDTTILNQRVKNLTNEIVSLKAKNRILHEEKLALQKSIKEQASRPGHVARRSVDVPRNMLDRIMELENQQKHLSSENNFLVKSAIRDMQKHGQQLDLLYSAIYASFLELESI